jgi:spore maturation protein CgeB
MRLYEATGCGALLVTDHAADLGELFTVDKELIAFKGTEDLIERLRYCLAHPQESASIALAGHKACLDRHTYRYRIEEFSAILQRYMS